MYYIVTHRGWLVLRRHQPERAGDPPLSVRLGGPAASWHNPSGSGGDRPAPRPKGLPDDGIRCRNFRDPNDPNATGVLAEIPDMAKFQALLQSAESQRAMQEDGLKVDTMRMLVEFVP